MTDSEDRFRPRLGKPGSQKAPAPKFISRVLKAAARAGPESAAPASRGAFRGTGRRGRGRVAAKTAGQAFGIGSRRVTVKVRLVNLKRAGARSAPTHLRYLEREGVALDAERGHAYGPQADNVDVTAFEAEGRGDRHQFRVIVSSEEGADIGDLKTFTRSLMSQVERDLGTRLEWIAVDHWDTGHPHTHLVLRGKDQRGEDLIIARDYLTRGFRLRACELATEWLGPRSEQEIEADWNRQIRAERWTGIDALLERHTQAAALDLVPRHDDYDRLDSSAQYRQRFWCE